MRSAAGALNPAARAVVARGHALIVKSVPIISATPSAMVSTSAGRSLGAAAGSMASRLAVVHITEAAAMPV